jgi:hypothetical protein
MTVEQFVEKYLTNRPDNPAIADLHAMLAARQRAVLAETITVCEQEAFEIALKHSGDVQLGCRFILETLREQAAIRQGAATR